LPLANEKYRLIGVKEESDAFLDFKMSKILLKGERQKMAII
jgi:hypothetical protein